MAVFISLILSDKPIAPRLYFGRPVLCPAIPAFARASENSFLRNQVDFQKSTSTWGVVAGHSLTGNVTPLHRANVNGRYSLTSSYLLFPS